MICVFYKCNFSYYSAVIEWNVITTLIFSFLAILTHLRTFVLLLISFANHKRDSHDLIIKLCLFNIL